MAKRSLSPTMLPTTSNKKAKLSIDSNPSSPTSSSSPVSELVNDAALSAEDLTTPITTIIVGKDDDTKTFKIQSDLLHASPVLSADAMKYMIEGQSGVITLAEDDPKIFAMIYTFLEAASNFKFDRPIRESPEAVAELFVMADKYQLVELQQAIIKAIDEQTTEDGLFLEGIKILCAIYDAKVVPGEKVQSAIDSYLYEESLAASKEDVTEINKFLAEDDIFSNSYLTAFHKAQLAKQSELEQEKEGLEEEVESLTEQKKELEGDLAQEKEDEEEARRRRIRMGRMKMSVDYHVKKNKEYRDTIRSLMDGTMGIEDLEELSDSDDEGDEFHDSDMEDEE